MRRALITLILILAVAQLGAAENYKVRVVRDLDYVAGTDYANNKDRLDLYVPEGRRQFPVIVSIHGGALMQGDKSEEAHIGQNFAAAGIGTAVISYRLSPSVSHPAHIKDAAAAFAWVKKHIAEYGGDPAAIFVIGHSAGAYLAGLLALDERYLRAEGLGFLDIRGVVPVSGFFYVDRVAPDRSKSVWGTDTRTWIDASPAKYLRPDAPPFLFIYADGDEDWRRAQNLEIAQAMTKAGHKDTAIKQISNRTHMSIWENVRDGEEVSNAITNFIAQRLKKNASQ